MTAHLVTGKVTDATNPARPVVKVDAETTPGPVDCVSSYTPVVNDRVRVLIDGTTRLCLGD